MTDDRPSGRELAAARARLIEYLQAQIGPALTAKSAQAVLEQAKAWNPATARELDRHFAEHTDALTAPSPHCPVALVRVLRQLEADGYGDAVTPLACALCGRAGRELPRRTPQGSLLRLVCGSDRASAMRSLRTRRPHCPTDRRRADLPAVLSQRQLTVLEGMRRLRAARTAGRPPGRRGLLPDLRTAPPKGMRPLR
ncbi:hypothetical protein GCM10009789_83570 [Kribbella sancticallisti]|uniref:DUF222 domain-containing protein n=1 Tax=Kribbella sancticallisti TaxID=460087 RepID=A0ABN2EVM7_9ACTN